MKEGLNPITNKVESSTRRAIKVEYELPIKQDYSAFIENILLKQAD